MPLSRRTLLKAAGVSIALPLLDAMVPIGLRAEIKAAAMSPNRLVLIGRPSAWNDVPKFTGNSKEEVIPAQSVASRRRV